MPDPVHAAAPEVLSAARSQDAASCSTAFLIVSNLETDDPSNIIAGNERVLRARLSDAKFFYDQDRKTRLADRVERLGSVVYHNKLGSQLERVQRIRKLAGAIAAEAAAPMSTRPSAPPGCARRTC